VNPRIGSGLQQRPQCVERRKPSRWWETTRAERDPGGWRRWAEDDVLRHGNREWTFYTEHRWRGPRGGDATESPDEANEGHAPVHGRRASRLQRAGPEQAPQGFRWSAGRSRPCRPRRCGEKPPVRVEQRRGSSSAAFGLRRRAREDLEHPTGDGQGEGGSGKGQRPATARAGGTHSGFIRAPRHLEPRPVSGSVRRATLRVTSRFLPIGFRRASKPPAESGDDPEG
jgi:hypothetical protein